MSLPRDFCVALALGAGVLTACGEGESTAPVPDPPEIAQGEMGLLAGTGQRGTDAIDADGDGEPDVLPALGATFDAPIDITAGPDGVFVLDWNGHKVRQIVGNRVHFVFGSGVEGDACEAGFTEAGCPALHAQINHPTDIALDDQGRLWLAAWHNSKIKRFDPQSGLVVDVCGTGNRRFDGDGGPCRDDTGEDLVSFDLPSGVVFDAAGGLLISDQANQVIRRLGPDGVVKVVAGQCPEGGFGCPAGRGYSGDGEPATEAMLANNLGQGTDPQGKIALDAEGNLFIADTGNHVIRKVTPGADGILGEGDPAEEIITTVAGVGTVPGRDGDGGPATEAHLASPTDVAVGPDGSLYIADRANSCIRRVDPQGTISTFAGRCGQPGPSVDVVLGSDAALREPYGVAVDAAAGRLYIADTLNHCVRQMMLP
jgi:sugar lactone lactonase YvrE